MPKKWDILPYKAYIEKCFSAGESIRMVAGSLGIDHTTLSKNAKAVGIHTPTKAESAKNVWKNHAHPDIGRKGELSPSFGHKMPEHVKKILQERCSGPNNYHWSGGIKNHSDGYILEYCPSHPYADRNGYVLQHRLIVERSIGRILSPYEIVHHIDGNKGNNALENLTVLTRSEHMKIHNIHPHREDINAGQNVAGACTSKGRKRSA